jgi:hypothetical protein
MRALIFHAPRLAHCPLPVSQVVANPRPVNASPQCNPEFNPTFPSAGNGAKYVRYISWGEAQTMVYVAARLGASAAACGVLLLTNLNGMSCAAFDSHGCYLTPLPRSPAPPSHTLYHVVGLPQVPEDLPLRLLHRVCCPVPLLVSGCAPLAEPHLFTRSPPPPSPLLQLVAHACQSWGLCWAGSLSAALGTP